MKTRYIALVGAALLVGWMVHEVGEMFDQVQANLEQRINNLPYQTR